MSCGSASFIVNWMDVSLGELGGKKVDGLEKKDTFLSELWLHFFKVVIKTKHLRNWSHFIWKELNYLSIDEKERDAHADGSIRPITQLSKKVARKWTTHQTKETMAFCPLCWDKSCICGGWTRYSEKQDQGATYHIKHIFSPLPCNTSHFEWTLSRQVY